MVGREATILCGLVISPVDLSKGTLKSTLKQYLKGVETTDHKGVPNKDTFIGK